MRLFWQKRKEENPHKSVEELSAQIGKQRSDVTLMLDFVNSMPIYADVLQHHGGKLQDLQEFYDQLELSGAG